MFLGQSEKGDTNEKRKCRLVSWKEEDITASLLGDEVFPLDGLSFGLS